MDSATLYVSTSIIKMCFMKIIRIIALIHVQVRVITASTCICGHSTQHTSVSCSLQPILKATPSLWFFHPSAAEKRSNLGKPSSTTVFKKKKKTAKLQNTDRFIWWCELF